MVLKQSLDKMGTRWRQDDQLFTAKTFQSSSGTWLASQGSRCVSQWTEEELRHFSLPRERPIKSGVERHRLGIFSLEEGWLGNTWQRFTKSWV